MSEPTVFVLSDETRQQIAASTSPIVVLTRDMVVPAFDNGARWEQALTSVADAKAAAQKSLDESDNPEAVSYRALIAARDEFEAALKAKVEEFEASLRAKNSDKITGQATAITEQRSVALKALADGAESPVDTTEAAAQYAAALATVQGFIQPYKDAGIDISLRRKSVESLTSAKGTRVGASGAKKPRWASLFVNGESVKNLTEAAKVIGLSAKEAADGFLLKVLTKDVGDLVPGHEYSAAVTHKGKVWNLVGSPKAAGQDDKSEEAAA
jgi:hypothetical protein